MTYKITTQISVEVFPYIDCDEEIPDYDCHESLAEMKEKVFLILDNVKDKIQKLTLKEIKKGIRL